MRRTTRVRARAWALAAASLSLLALGAPADEAAAPSAVPAEGADPGDRWFGPSSLARHEALEERVAASLDRTRLSAWHDLLASELHVAGSDGDLEVARRIAKAFRDMGLEVEEHETWPYLPRPVSATLEALVPREDGTQERIPLPVKELPVEGDPWSQRPDLPVGWNAYSGSGDVTGEVVYANYGTKADFEKLRELGVETRGRVVVARYGGNFRGYKAKYAEAAGAAALVIFTDPEDSGYVKGPTWPEGGWSTESSIQRGSLLTLPYYGDPLTPGHAATRNAKRLAAADVALPRIPVQPVSWSAAREILGRMRGPAVPEEWQGGLPFAYRLTGDGAVKARVAVVQHAEPTRTVSVVGRLRGAVHPEQLVIFGAHHDAWGYGAADPTSGTIAVLECARAFAEAAQAGLRCDRTLVFAAWSAEEFGIIGSSEWVEAHEKELAAHAVAYLNADMVSLGTELGCSGSPSLEAVLVEAAADVAQPGSPSESALDGWRRRSKEPGPSGVTLGDMGGGSDHVGFLCHLGVPSAAPSGGGAKGSSYHAMTDDLAWYRAVVGGSYDSAHLVASIDARVLARLANADVLPLDPSRAAAVAALRLADCEKAAREAGLTVDLSRVAHAARLHEARAKEVHASLLKALAEGRLTRERLDAVNARLLLHERQWVRAEGLPGRPWLRTRFAAPDETSGYAAWMLPGLRAAIERKDESLLIAEREALVEAFGRLDGSLAAIAEKGVGIR